MGLLRNVGDVVNWLRELLVLIYVLEEGGGRIAVLRRTRRDCQSQVSNDWVVWVILLSSKRVSAICGLDMVGRVSRRAKIGLVTRHQQALCTR